MALKTLPTAPTTDPGSEGGLGYDYQWHIAVRLCIQMLLNRDIVRIICEYGEDVQIVRSGLKLEPVQIKKREGKPWTMGELTKPARGQSIGILGKLFLPLQEGKNIQRLSLIGYGRTSAGEDLCSLPEFIALLKVPLKERGPEWRTSIAPYSRYLASELAPQQIIEGTVSAAVEILDIDFALPHPDSIESESEKVLGNVVKQIWEVDLSLTALCDIYTKIYNRVKQAMLKPNKSWADKSIEREDLFRLVQGALPSPHTTADPQHTLTLMEKLTEAGLSAKHKYSLEARTKAIGLRFEWEMTSDVWENLKTEIHIAWQAYRAANDQVRGLALWNALREELSKLGKSWASLYADERLGPSFAEGVFFDMAGICIADFK